jgi:cytochrome c-type biogenesis protein CcmE
MEPRHGHTVSISCWVVITFVTWIVSGVLPLCAAQASGLMDLADLISHPEQYDRQEVVVSGQVTNVQLATNRQGQPAYGFLLRDSAGTVKVVGLGQVEVREGDQVIVEGIFSRLRQAGRTIIYNEIKALSIRSLSRLNPDLVG